MKKTLVTFFAIIVIAIAAIIAASFIASTPTCREENVPQNHAEDTAMFVIAEKTDNYLIVYHKDTRVMYAVSYGTGNIGTFTVLVGADGLPMIYGGGNEQNNLTPGA